MNGAFQKDDDEGTCLECYFISSTVQVYLVVYMCDDTQWYRISCDIL